MDTAFLLGISWKFDAAGKPRLSMQHGRNLCAAVKKRGNCMNKNTYGIGDTVNDKCSFRETKKKKPPQNPQTKTTNSP